ncbi:MAG: hypothetical protein ABEJ75_03510 [Candidatus Nanohaloarchaea archaeon]
MRKTLVLLTVFALSLSTSTAIVNYTGPENQPHIMAQPDSSGASASTGQNFSLRFEKLNISLSPGVRDKITDVSVKDVNGTWRFSFQGQMQLPTPCYRVDRSLSVDGNSYVLNLEKIPTNETCVQSLAVLEYQVSGEIQDREFTLEVQHDGKTIDTLSREVKKEKEAGFFSMLARWFTGLFG